MAALASTFLYYIFAYTFLKSKVLKKALNTLKINDRVLTKNDSDSKESLRKL